MPDIVLARMVHVPSVVLWIGGVAFITLVVIPGIRAAHAPHDRLSAFHEVEARFAWQAGLWVALAGLSGFWMVHRARLWGLFLDPVGWWLHLMVLVWTLFAAMIYLLEPLFLHRRMAASSEPASDFVLIERLHRVLLALSLAAVAGAVGGAHGLY